MTNTINDFIIKWKELKAEKDYEYNFLNIKDAIYIDRHYQFDIDQLFNDEKYGNTVFLNALKKKKDIHQFIKNEDLNIACAIRCFVAFKDPFYTKDFWDIDVKILNNTMVDILCYNKAYLDQLEKYKRYYSSLASIGYKPELMIKDGDFLAISYAMNFIDQDKLIDYLDSDNHDIYCNAIDHCTREQLEKYGVDKLKNKKGALLCLIRKGFFLEDGINSDDMFEVSSAIDNDCDFNEKQLVNKFKDEGTRDFNLVLNSIDCYNLRHHRKLKKHYKHNAMNILINNINFSDYWINVVKFGTYSNKIRLVNEILKHNLQKDLLDLLVTDKAFQVRIAVAKSGIPKYLDKLKDDENEYVRLVVSEQLRNL